MVKDYAADELVERAMRETGIDRFDTDTWREGLGLYLADYNTNQRAEEFNEANAAYVVKAISDRLRVEQAIRQRPEVLDGRIERPLFVFGMPRTGTTLMNNLFAADPNRRSALSWEIEMPVPPPTTATLKTDPRALAMLEAERAALAANPGMGKYYRFSAIYPNECLFITQGEFKSLLWEGRGKLPNYREWMFSDASNMITSYEYHRRWLQLHQVDAPGIWNLKLPSHSLWLEILLKVYPDARLVWTHRDPFTATGSYCSLMRLSSNTAIGHADLDWIAENYPWQIEQHYNRIMDTRARIGHDRIVDVHYADLMRDPIAAVKQLYAKLGDAWTAEAEAGIQAWVDDNPQGKFGKHEYKLAEFGLTPEMLRPRFERYFAEYEVEPEG